MCLNKYIRIHIHYILPQAKNKASIPEPTLHQAENETSTPTPTEPPLTTAFEDYIVPPPPSFEDLVVPPLPGFKGGVSTQAVVKPVFQKKYVSESMPKSINILENKFWYEHEFTQKDKFWYKDEFLLQFLPEFWPETLLSPRQRQRLYLSPLQFLSLPQKVPKLLPETHMAPQFLSEAQKALQILSLFLFLFLCLFLSLIQIQFQM